MPKAKIGLNETEQKILVRAAEILSDENHWTNGTFGNWQWLDQEPKVCASGAVRRATIEVLGIRKSWWKAMDDQHSLQVQRALTQQAIYAIHGKRSIPWVNDQLGYQAVKNLFCKAIKAEVDETTE